VKSYWMNIQDALDDLMIALGKIPEAKQNVLLRKELMRLTRLRNLYKRQLIEQYVEEITPHMN
jgi:hypothetical protein